MNRFRKNEKGFTLVELLIVVAIIGILAAIAIPQFVKYKKSAGKSACDSDLRNCLNEVAAQYANGTWNNGTTCVALLPGNKIGATVQFFDTTGSYTLGSVTAVTYNGISTTPALDNNSVSGRAANCTVQ